MATQFEEIEKNFHSLGFEESSIKIAINHLKLWLLHPEFELYQPQINHLLETKQYAELFDSFYQVIPFGTAGRRGKVGIGYNRINQWTIAASVQGHSQYLLKEFKEEAKERGVVIAYDVRQYTNQTTYSNYLNNPIWGLTSRQLAEIAATVYARNGIKVNIFSDVCATPQLSFTIRELEAVSGVNITASHNPPDYNGIKVYDSFGGQLLPPYDQELIDEINNNVNVYDVKWQDFKEAQGQGNINIINEKTENKYVTAVKKVSLSKNRNIKVVYSSLHGTGRTSVYKVMKNMGFDIELESEGSIPSGEFETVPNHTPDPANLNVYWNAMNLADKIEADIIITTDPDADRVGIMAKNTKGKWVLFDGNEMVVLLSYFILEKKKRLKQLNENSTLIYTLPVTRLINKLAKAYNVKKKSQLFPGFKYIAHEINKMDKKGIIEDFLVGMEDTFGQLAGNYARDKDSCVAAILLSEFAAELKSKALTLCDALEAVYTKFGYHKLTTAQIKFEYSYEKKKLDKAFKKLRKTREESFKKFKVKKFIDHLAKAPIKSETDRGSRDVLEFYFEPVEGFEVFRIILRPSGTEPIVKIYIEIGTSENLEQYKILRDKAEKLTKELVDYFVKDLHSLME